MCNCQFIYKVGRGIFGGGAISETFNRSQNCSQFVAVEGSKFGV